jgi:hypothetical protein
MGKRSKKFVGQCIRRVRMYYHGQAEITTWWILYFLTAFLSSATKAFHVNESALPNLLRIITLKDNSTLIT